MKNKKKWVSLVTAVAILTLVTSACTSKEKEGAASSVAPTPTSSEPAKIRMFMTDSSLPVPGGATMDDPTFKYAAQKTNTNLDVVFLPNGQYDQQLKTRFASGDMPDVVQGWGINGDLLVNDQLVPLDDYLNKYGPNLKKVIPQSAWDAVTRNGKIYAIPEAAKGNTKENRMLFVRKDWMDKVGIKEAPKTPEELLVLLRAFRDGDPNGNGKKDEIPYSARENFSWVENLLGMYGQTQYTVKYENNELIPGIITSNMKQGIGFIRQMVQEKLMDSEFLTNKRAIWEQKIQQDLVGMWNHDPSLSWDWQDKLNKSLPGKGADVIAIMTPRAPGVQNAGSKDLPINKTFVVTKKAKDPAAIVKFFDWLVTQEGQEFVNFGVPNVTYTKDNGKINYNKQKDTDDKTAGWRPLSLNLVGFNEELLKVQLGDDKAVAKLKAAYEVGQKESIPDLLLGSNPFKSTQPEIGELNNGTTSTMFLETASRIALGDKPLDYFDEFVKNYRAQGGNDLIKQATEWYNANKKK
ncbi:extracellular solute-binding protein [Paenibacillus roseipurpureus]|uniref:Extracellular solute-binding protein n=1 Tax=Paenibacillus roseopurpureus TaxID=2918901 RepID=A0AA96RLW3_9BACL|nr:extracellular solute-binding protein [Paenibacillus sp. MBLB1832]WNR46100.1 extracellular solute-binding protein [Paenibacillus sp. MBLB1832]